MTQSATDKWKPIVESMGVTGEKADWLSQYANSHSQNENFLPDTWKQGLTSSRTKGTQSFCESYTGLLPIAMKVVAQTIGLDIVAVKPMGGGNSKDEIEKIDAEIKAENRDGKIDAIIEDKEYIEKTREDHPLYEKGKGPLGQLMYMDFKYDGSLTPPPAPKPHQSVMPVGKKKGKKR